MAVQEQLFNISEQSRRATSSKIQQEHPCIFSPCFCFALAPHVYRCVSSLSLHSGEDDLRIPIKFRFITAKPLDFGQRRAATSIYNLTAASLCSKAPALLGQTTSGRETGKALLLAQPDHERKMICHVRQKSLEGTSVSGGHCRHFFWAICQFCQKLQLILVFNGAVAIFIIGCTFKSIILCTAHRCSESRLRFYQGDPGVSAEVEQSHPYFKQ